MAHTAETPATGLRPDSGYNLAAVAVTSRLPPPFPLLLHHKYAPPKTAEPRAEPRDKQRQNLHMKVQITCVTIN